MAHYGVKLVLVFLGCLIEPGGKIYTCQILSLKLIVCTDLSTKFIYSHAGPHCSSSLHGYSSIKSNDTFSCECTHGDLCSQPFWSLENEGSTFVTNDERDLETSLSRA